MSGEQLRKPPARAADRERKIRVAREPGPAALEKSGEQHVRGRPDSHLLPSPCSPNQSLVLLKPS